MSYPMYTPELGVAARAQPVDIAPSARRSRRVLIETHENARGIPLAGAGLKVSKALFSISLSNVAAERARNLQYLKEQSWIDIPIVYASGRRAILAIEKGASGQRSFHEALLAWEPPR